MLPGQAAERWAELSVAAYPRAAFDGFFAASLPPGRGASRAGSLAEEMLWAAYFDFASFTRASLSSARLVFMVSSAVLVAILRDDASPRHVLHFTAIFRRRFSWPAFRQAARWQRVVFGLRTSARRIYAPVFFIISLHTTPLFSPLISPSLISPSMMFRPFAMPPPPPRTHVRCRRRLPREASRRRAAALFDTTTITFPSLRYIDSWARFHDDPPRIS